MKFLFVDRILEFIPGKKTTGLKYVTENDGYFGASPDGKLILLPSIVGEALGQLCSWNVLKSSDFQLRLVGGVIQEINMFADAYIGDSIYLENEIQELDLENRFVRCSAVASVQGKKLLSFYDAIAPLLLQEELSSTEEVKINFAKLHQPDPAFNPAALVNNSVPTTDLSKMYQINHDNIISWNGDNELIAEKQIPASTPYFLDHFPRKPVFPLSLLIEYNLQLAYAFFSKHLNIPVGKMLRPNGIRKVKIGNFVLPGDTLTSRITIKERRADGFTLSFLNSVGNKKACVAEAELSIW